MRSPWTALLAVLPALWGLRAGTEAAFGRFSVDLAGHLWMGWSASQGPLTRTTLVGWPEGLDLMPVLGGWLDVMLVGALSPWLGLITAYNLVIVLYLFAAGLGGAALARALGASAPAAAAAGLLLQLDPFVLHHVAGGRPEQVGLGFVALALAAAVRCGRGAQHWALCGLAGAAVVFVSWELTLLLALLTVGVVAIVGLGERPPGALGRWVRALGVFALTAGPWIATFLSRAGAVRARDEGSFALETAGHASVGLLGWFGADALRPAALPLLALLALPWALRRRDRALGAGVAVALGVSLALALGPRPGLWTPGPPGEPPSGLFTWIQGLPILGWFHWPDRLLAVWSLAVAAASGAVVQKLGAWRRAAGVLAAAALVGSAAARVERLDLWPEASFEVYQRPAALALGALDEPGAVVDLPIQPDIVRHLAYMLDQLGHGRPILFHMVLGHLDGGASGGRVAADPLLRWFAELMAPTPPAPRVFQAEDLQPLRDQGFRFLVLHREGWPPDRWAMGRRALQESLGPPVLEEGEDWLCWRLEGR